MIVASVVGPLHAGQSSGQSTVTMESRSSTTSVISPVVMATWFAERRDGTTQLDLLVLWRGPPGWFTQPGGSGGRGGGSSRPQSAWITHGALTLTVEFDPSERVAVVQGQRLDLGDDNVVLVDDVHSPTGPRVTGTLRAPRAMPGSAGQIGLVLRESPEVVSFLRCDARRADGRGQAYLERLCLQNLGIGGGPVVPQ
jgi:hypothetical protein